MDKKIDTLFCRPMKGHQDHDVANFIVSKLKHIVKYLNFLNIIFMVSNKY